MTLFCIVDCWFLSDCLIRTVNPFLRYVCSSIVRVQNWKRNRSSSRISSPASSRIGERGDVDGDCILNILSTDRLPSSQCHHGSNHQPTG
eukprot:3409928-Rhodomonas_salina.2